MRSAEKMLTRIGPSEFGAILGLDPRRGAHSVWAQRLGLYEIEQSTRMAWGQYCQQAIANWYSAATGRRIAWLDTTILHPVYEWLAYTPDAACVDEKRGIDAKYVNVDQQRQWGENSDATPEQVQTQMIGYMGATGYPYWDAAVVVGSELRIYTWERDAELEAVVFEEVEQWWRRHILGGEEPPIDGTNAASDYLRQRFPRHRDLVRIATGKEIGLLEHYARVRDYQKPLDKERKLIENQLKQAVGTAEGLTWPRGEFTWRNPKEKTTVDWQGLALKLMEGCPPERREQLTGEFSRTQPGSRRISFRCEGSEEEEE